MPTDLHFLNTNPEDAGRFTNHSASPNMGIDGALRDIASGEQLTMDYSFHGNPEWYQNICAKYGVLTEAEIAKLDPTAEIAKSHPTAEACVESGAMWGLLTDAEET